MLVMRDSLVQRCSSILNLFIKTGDHPQMRLQIMLSNHALSILEESFMRILYYQEVVLSLITLIRDLTSKFKKELMIDLTNTNKSLAKHQNQLKSKQLRIWFRDMLSGLEVVCLEVQNISIKFATAEKIIWKEDHQFADITQYSQQDFE